MTFNNDPEWIKRKAEQEDGRYVSVGGLVADMERHDWNHAEFKPWTCRKCGFYTANLRHIENGFCRHVWGERLGLPCCLRCGVVRNSWNAERPCIGIVKVETRVDNREMSK